MPLEVGAPQIIGRQGRARRLARMADAPAIALLGHHAVAAQDVAYRRSMRKIPARMPLVHQCQELLAAPRWLTSPSADDRHCAPLRGPIRRFVRSSGSLL